MQKEWITVRLADNRDFSFLAAVDRHIPPQRIREKIDNGEILIAEADQERVGYLRWGWFWDNTPFMNLLFVLEAWRGRGIGSRLTETWEKQMGDLGEALVLTSTYASESAQHFYRKHGYRDSGGFVLPDEPLELILFKRLHPPNPATET